MLGISLLARGEVGNAFLGSRLLAFSNDLELVAQVAHGDRTVDGYWIGLNAGVQQALALFAADAQLPRYVVYFGEFFCSLTLTRIAHSKVRSYVEEMAFGGASSSARRPTL